MSNQFVLQIVAVKDNAVDAFLPIVSVPHVGSAIREFNSSCNNEQHEFFKHALDYDLYHLGTFNSATGEISGFASPIRLSRGIDAKVSVH